MLKKILRPLYVPVLKWHYETFKAPKRYRQLFREIETIGATSILEVGTWNGARAVQMIKKAQKVTGKDIRYIGFDLFEDLSDEMYVKEISKRPPSQDEVADRLKVAGADVVLIKGNTMDTLPAYAEYAGKVDFVFIDGGHSAATVQSDWDAVSKLMHERTVVIFDDYWKNRPDQSAKPVVDQINQDKYDVEVLPVTDVFDNQDFGHLEINFAKVTLKKGTTAAY